MAADALRRIRISEEIRAQMTFHPVMTVEEVLDRALEPAIDVAHAS